jgi:DNA-binding CsgD family transcriptional regulator
MHDQKCLEQWQQIQAELFSAAYYYYYYLQACLLKTKPAVAKHKLNKREIQCLLLIAKQYSVATIAKELKITARTVNYHVQRLNKKLGTKNKYQSVIKALQTNLIKL